MPALPDGAEHETRAAARLWELAEHEPPVVAGTFAAPCSTEPVRLLAGVGALVATANATTVTCRACNEQHLADVDFDADTRSYGHFCPEAGWVAVAAADLVRHEVDLDWLVDRLSAALNITARPTCLVEEILWELGEARAGPRSWTAFFARRLSVGSNLDQVSDALGNRPGKAQGLVLTTTSGISSRVALPGGHTLVPVQDCARLDSGGLLIDHRVIVALLDQWGGRSRSRTGMAGRPTAKHLYIAEHQRRITTGEVQDQLAEEARHLHRWMEQTHPDMPAGKPATVENNIRDAHRLWRAANPRN